MNSIMKICWATVIAMAAITLTMPAQAESKTKQVCKDVVDKQGKPVKNKDGSVKQACKTIKVHKKLEGTPVPDKKK
jgi:ABC-type transporter MlaC component